MGSRSVYDWAGELRSIDAGGSPASQVEKSLNILTLFPSQARITKVGNDLGRQGSKGIFAQMFDDNLGASQIGRLCGRTLRRHNIRQIAFHRGP